MFMNHWYENSSNYLFVGETGSGKTELSIHLARSLANDQSCPVHLVDMDQTKGLFRARDLAEVLQKEGVYLTETVSFMDAPVSPIGVSGLLRQENVIRIFDIGGNAVGARMLGQYNDQLQQANTCIYYVINPYRPFSATASGILQSMDAILAAGRLTFDQVRIISNPTYGRSTTLEDILIGHQRLTDTLESSQLKPVALVVPEAMKTAVQKSVSCPLIPIQTHIEPLYNI